MLEPKPVEVDEMRVAASETATKNREKLQKMYATCCDMTRPLAEFTQKVPLCIASNEHKTRELNMLTRFNSVKFLDVAVLRY